MTEDNVAQAVQLEDLSRQIGEMIHNWGFKRIHGRIWSLLFISNRPLDAADFIERLGISKALVSISLRELLEVKAIEEVGRSARSTHLYRANQDLKSVYIEVLKTRERKMLEQTAAALAALSTIEQQDLAASEISPSQVATLASHLKTAMSLLDQQVAAAEATIPSETRTTGLQPSEIRSPFTALREPQSAPLLPVHAG